MTEAKMIELARECGATPLSDEPIFTEPGSVIMSPEQLAEYTKRIRQEEREKSSKACEKNLLRSLETQALRRCVALAGKDGELEAQKSFAVYVSWNNAIKTACSPDGRVPAQRRRLDD